MCLLTLVIQQVFARPISGQDYHFNMSLEPNDQSLTDALRFPCGKSDMPQEDQSLKNIKAVLGKIEWQSSIAKSAAKEDVVKYVSVLSMKFSRQIYFRSKFKYHKHSRLDRMATAF